jgi:hypothetical protein
MRPKFARNAMSPLPGDTQRPFDKLRRQRRPVSALPALAVVPVASQCHRRMAHDSGKLVERPAAGDLVFYSQPPAPVMVKWIRFFPSLSLRTRFFIFRHPIASCRLRVTRQKRSNNCHVWNCSYMFLRMRGGQYGASGNAETCQRSQTRRERSAARVVASANCGSAGFFALRPVLPSLAFSAENVGIGLAGASETSR